MAARCAARSSASDVPRDRRARHLDRQSTKDRGLACGISSRGYGIAWMRRWERAIRHTARAGNPWSALPELADELVQAGPEVVLLSRKRSVPLCSQADNASRAHRFVIVIETSGSAWIDSKRRRRLTATLQASALCAGLAGKAARACAGDRPGKRNHCDVTDTSDIKTTANGMRSRLPPRHLECYTIDGGETRDLRTSTRPSERSASSMLTSSSSAGELLASRSNTYR